MIGGPWASFMTLHFNPAGAQWVKVVETFVNVLLVNSISKNDIAV